MTVAVATAVLVKQTETDQVDDEAHGAHPQDHLGVVDVLRLIETFQALNSDREAEGNQEHSIDQSSKNFRSGPAEGVFRPGLGSHSDAEECYHQGCDVGQHVEAVRHQSHGVSEVA